MLEGDVNEPNKYFNETAETVVPSHPHTKQELECFISLFSDKDDVFQYRVKALKNISKHYKITDPNVMIIFQHLLSNQLLNF